MTFRHPRRKDKDGKWGLKIRRGLGTVIDEEADVLVDQINELLSNQGWWNVNQRANAEDQFDKVAVSAFYDGIEAGKINSIELREERIPLPTHEDGYAQIMLVGTTGAGKTTLLRHLIGSDHKQDRFPSTSTARTTTADIEIIMSSDESYEAAITFINRSETRIYVEECLQEACMAVIENKSDEQIAERLLTHSEQRFRLSYLLGTWQDAEETISSDDFLFEDDNIEEPTDAEIVALNEKEQNASQLREYVKRIKEAVSVISTKLAKELNSLSNQESPSDTEAWLELFAEEVSEEEDIKELAKNIVEDIKKRIDMVKAGDFVLDPTGWPLMWTCSEPEREIFLKEVRSFASNHFRQFGRLLTPLVDGMRVRGKFQPTRPELQVADKLVLIDGQGLGHTAKSAASISTDVSERFFDVDMILLVDNAEQPMQAAPLALLRSVGISGHTHKLALAFTHFDLVKGDNLGSFPLMRDHVLNSVRNATSSLRESLGSAVATALETQIYNRTFFLGGLDKTIESIPRGFILQLKDLLAEMQIASGPTLDIDVAPKYSVGGLEVALQDAVRGFKQPWKAKLGLEYREGISKEHWARIKALNRRFAELHRIEYNDLKPVADLVARVQESLSRWLDNPIGWTRIPDNDEEKFVAISNIRNDVYVGIHDISKQRLSTEEIDAWWAAFQRRGTGSTRDRAKEIDEIYERAAPRISSVPNEESDSFLKELHTLIQKAVKENGGQLLYHNTGSSP